MTSWKDRLLYFGAYPVGHGAVDWGGAALWLLAPAMALAMDLSPAKVGLLFTGRAIGAGIAYFPAGILGDSVRRRGPFLLSTFWWVVAGYLAASVAGPFWLVVVLIAFASAGAGAWHPVAMGDMVRRMPERRAMALAIHGIGGTIAEVLAPLSVGFLVAFMDWRQALQVSTIPAVLLGVVFLRVAWLVPPSPQVSFPWADVRYLGGVLQRPASLGILLVLMLHSMSIIALMSMTPLYLVQERGLSSGVAGSAFAALVLTAAVAAPFMGRLSDSVGRKRLSLLGLAGGAIAVVLMTVVPNTALLVLVMMVGGMLLISLRAILMATALEMVGMRHSTVLGFLFTIGEGIGALGAVLAGAVGNTDLSRALMLAAALALAAGVVAVVHPFTRAQAAAVDSA